MLRNSPLQWLPADLPQVEFWSDKDHSQLFKQLAALWLWLENSLMQLELQNVKKLTLL